jgi:16S rRNA (cytidine1402-2'-O)-methyltransferase
MEVDKDSPHTLVFYESPYRLADFLKDAMTVYGDRKAAVANDLTKLFERVDRARLSELVVMYEKETPRGEYCVVIGAAQASQPAEED